MRARISRSFVIDSTYPLYRNSEHTVQCLFAGSMLLTTRILAQVAIGNAAILSGCMDALRHLLTAALLALVLNWLWKSSRAGKAKAEAGRKIFGPTRGIQIVTVVCGVLFAALVVGSAVALRKPSDWWVPFLFMAFLALVPFMYPPVLTIDVDCVSSRAWYGSEKKIRWEDVGSLHYNTGNNQFTIRSHDGRKITHAGYNADPDGFQKEIQRRTRLPLKVAQPGTWKTETIEVPYEESQEESDDRVIR